MALTPRVTEKTPPRTPYCICIFNHVENLFQQKNEINANKTREYLRKFKVFCTTPIIRTPVNSKFLKNELRSFAKECLFPEGNSRTCGANAVGELLDFYVPQCIYCGNIASIVSGKAFRLLRVPIDAIVR